MTSRPTNPDDAPEPVFRSAAVARLARMPVSTLRIWEQRYAAVRPVTAPSGHRRYSARDVERVRLLRRLTEHGHAIGSIAPLGTPQLRRLAQTLDAEEEPHGLAAAAPGAGARLVVVGSAMGLRLQRPGLAARFGPGVQVVAVLGSLAEAVAAGPALRADLLLWHAPELQPAAASELHAARHAVGAGSAAVVYRFAGADATRAMAEAGVAALREPADDDALGAWLSSIAGPLPRADRPPVPGLPEPSPADAVPPRRFDDAALTAIAGLSPTLACECPRHLAELLMQMSSFEAYSAGCANRSPADAELHAHLQHLAGRARALFESALERVARHEGLSLR